MDTIESSGNAKNARDGVENGERGDASTNSTMTTGSVSRRAAVLAAGGGVGALLASGLVSAAGGTAHKHADHKAPNTELLEAAHNCSLTGQLCLNHCLESFLAGDTMLAECAKSIVAMIPLCEAFVVQVANHTDYVDGLASVCRAACVDCEKECRKHEDHHSICKESADACAKLVAMIDNMS